MKMNRNKRRAIALLFTLGGFMTRKQVIKKIGDFCIFSIGVIIMAITLTYSFQLFKFSSSEFVRSILTVALLVLFKFMEDRIERIIACIAGISIVLTGCILGMEVLIQSASTASKLVFPFLCCYGMLLLAVHLLYVSNPSFWDKVHRDKEAGDPLTGMLPDIYRMVAIKEND